LLQELEDFLPLARSDSWRTETVPIFERRLRKVLYLLMMEKDAEEVRQLQGAARELSYLLNAPLAAVDEQKAKIAEEEAELDNRRGTDSGERSQFERRWRGNPEPRL
jgi:hypothetical protein